MPEPYSISLLNDSFPPLIDGVANTVVNYARELTKLGDRAIVVTPEHPDADDSRFPFPVVRYPSVDTRRLFGYLAGYPFSPETLRQLKEQKVDLLHSHCPVMSTILARSIRDVVDAPLVFTYHTKFDVDVAKLLRGRLLQESALYVLASNISACDEVWVVSHGAGENLRSIGYQGDYQVMENGVDMPRGRVSEEAITAATTDYDLPEGVPVFLFVGRMMWYKGLRIILDALRLLQAGGQDFRMVFIGSGADAAEVQEYAKPLGSKCIFTGAISQRETLRAWYCRADLFLFPSSYDTNGLVVREAAACDLAAVLIDGSCAAEGVTDGVDGFLIDENAGSMAAKLQEICKRPECMAQVGRQAGDRLYLSWGDAVKRARERYGIVVFIEQDHFPLLMNILRRLDDGNRLSDDDMLWLKADGQDYYSEILQVAFHEREAEFYASEYRRTSDPWNAVNASGHFRKCEQPQKAHDLLTLIPSEQRHAPKLRSAIATTHGGVMRDLRRLDDALRLGNQAHELTPKDFRPCTLLGAVNFELGHYDIGRDWYAKAIERGATERSVDYDLRGILLRADPAKREEIKAFLLREDPLRYRWVGNLHGSRGRLRKRKIKHAKPVAGVVMT